MNETQAKLRGALRRKRESMSSQRQMHLGVFAIGTGNHIAGWRYEGAGTSSEDFEILAAIASSAERAKLDFLFVADNLACLVKDHPGLVARLEPLTLLAALGARTSHLGLVATASTTYSEPYNLARAFASIDHISGGRSGWNVVTTSTQEAAANFSRATTVSHDRRYEIAAEFVDVVQGLWDTWEAGARVADRSSGRYLDEQKIHSLNHKGEFFTVAGPLNASRSPQGQPVIVQAGSSSSGQHFAARFAEVMFTVQHDIEEARKFYAGVKSQVLAAGRSADHCKIMPGVFPVVARTDEEAWAKLADLMKYVDSTSAMRTMSERFGHDMSQYPLDGPIPELPPSDRVQSYAKVLIAMGRRKNLKLRDLYNNMAVARGYIVACGSPTTVADMLQEWFETRAADGFIITPAYFPAAFDAFNALVVPELQRRGLFRAEYQGATLRDHLGLPAPANRFAANRERVRHAS
jgi:FMN-dependent oxidoreductase (nitrilotriacetate monooxygenase family)